MSRNGSPYRGTGSHSGVPLTKGPLMSVFSVDTGLVMDTATRTRMRVATIQTEVDAMTADIGSLQSSWTDSASDAMAACAADWQTTQLQVQASLDAISLALDQAADSYDTAESANSRRFGPGPVK